MKSKCLSVICVCLLAVSVAGCGSATSEEIVSIEPETLIVEESQTEVEEQKKVEKQTEEEVTADLTFEDLAKLRFEFSSGAGAWAENFTIEKDGYFKGLFNDSDMGSTGEGYSDGTRYSSSYTGHFTDLVKINEYTYEMKLADISYRNPAGTEEISDNIRYIYTESYCLGGTDTFTIYLPGTPLSELSEAERIWLFLNGSSDTELSMVAIVDKDNEYGIYSYERPSPLEDAQMTLDSYRESYEYYGKRLSEAATTEEMVEYSGTMYGLSDDCLNYIWNLVRYNVEQEEYKQILAEQREWIAQKEAKAKETSIEYEGGSFAAVSYNDTLASLTMERCEELIEYLK